MTPVRLGEVIAPVQGRAGETDLPVYSVTKHRGFVPSEEYFKKQVFSNDLSTYKVVDQGQFAYATIHLDEGSIGVAPAKCVISPMYTVFAVDETRVLPDYLIRFLKSPGALASYSRLGRGTAERRKSISLEALGRLDVPLPPLPEQRRIAAILDDADAVRLKHKRSRDLISELTDSAFDAVTRRTDGLAPLADLVELTTGPFGSSIHKSDYQLGGTPLINPSHIRAGRIVADLKVAVSESKASDLRSFSLRDGDVVLGRRGEIGRTAVVEVADLPAICGTGTMILRPFDGPPIGRFIARLLRTPRYVDLLTAAASGVTMLNLSQAAVTSLKVPIPTPALLAQVDLIDSAVGARLDVAEARGAGLDALFASLQDRAFGGEL